MLPLLPQTSITPPPPPPPHSFYTSSIPIYFLLFNNLRFLSYFSSYLIPFAHIHLNVVWSCQPIYPSNHVRVTFVLKFHFAPILNSMKLIVLMVLCQYQLVMTKMYGALNFIYICSCMVACLFYLWFAISSKQLPSLAGLDHIQMESAEMWVVGCLVGLMTEIGMNR